MNRLLLILEGLLTPRQPEVRPLPLRDSLRQLKCMFDQYQHNNQQDIFYLKQFKIQAYRFPHERDDS